jgi:hypothetical protein
MAEQVGSGRVGMEDASDSFRCASSNARWPVTNAAPRRKMINAAQRLYAVS